MVMNRKRILLAAIGIAGAILFLVLPIKITIENLIPFQNIDLGSLVSQPNDFPNTLFTSSFALQGPDPTWHYDMLGEQTVFSAPGKEVGWVSVYVFHSISDGREMFNDLSLLNIYMESQEGVFTFDMPEVGDYMFATTLYEDEQRGLVVNLTFQRCYGVVHIHFHRAYADDFVSYARRLDERLKGSVCDKVKNLLGR